MAYHVDFRDVQFNVFDFLNISQLLHYPAFSEQNLELYQMVLDESLKFAQKELEPINASGDREGCKLVDGKVTTPRGYPKAFAAFAENGYVSMDANPALGGQGLPHTMRVAAYEFLTGANIPLSMYGGLTHGAAHLIESFGSDSLVQLFCEKMYRGQWAGTMCLTEPGAGSAVGDLKSTATPLPDGTYSISGQKIFISGGDQDLTENIVHLLLARIPGDPAGTKGISLFVVPKYWVSKDGQMGALNDVICTNLEHKMGIKASSTCALSFGESGQCRGILLGERAQGMRYMFQMMNEARLLCGVQGSSVAAASYEHAWRYASERVQAGVNILNYPDVRRNLALCRSLSEGMRALVYYAAFYLDLAEKEKDPVKKARYQNRIDFLTPICKAYCSDHGFKVTELAMQIYGGYGYVSDYPIEQYMRDVKISSIYEGTNGIQALDLLGRKISANQGLFYRELCEDIVNTLMPLAAQSQLQKEVQELKKAIERIGQVLQSFAEQMMSGQKEAPFYHATPFLEMMGHTVIAFLLLHQAMHCESLAKINTENPTFYQNKIHTARFFAAQFLPRVHAFAKTMQDQDRSAFSIIYQA